MTDRHPSLHPMLTRDGHAPTTLAAVLHARANSSSTVTLLEARGSERALTLADLARSAQSRLAHWQQRGLKVGDAVILLTEDRLAFLEAFWAATLGGAIPVPVSGGISDEHRAKVLRIATRLDGPWLFTDDSTLERLSRFAAECDDSELRESCDAISARALLTSDAAADAAGARLHDAQPDDIALIQFSSGSTSAPKGVVLTHHNLMTNLDAILHGMDMQSDDCMLSWMPLTHDMGLIGFHLTPVTADIDHVLMGTDVFVRRPGLWLTAASEHRASVLCSPNFGYEHYLKSFKADKIDSLDLSRVRLVFNGAEPISAPLIDRFNAALAPFGLSPTAMFPVYGLAEASLAVCFPPIGRAVVEQRLSRQSLGVGEAVQAATASAASFVSVGTCVPHVDVRIAADNGESVADQHVGHVLMRGDNVTAGYLISLQDPARDSASIDADGWLDTGDLGFLDAGELYITGRAKDIVFANGQNLYPHDLENILINAGVVDPGKLAVAAAPEEGGDALVVFVLHRAGPDEFVAVRDAVRRVLAAEAGVSVDRVVPVPRIPKTTSGKVQRFQLVADYQAGTFNEALAELPPELESAEASELESVAAGKPADDAATSVAARLLNICNTRVTDQPVGEHDNLFELGISSLTLAEIHADIEEVWPDTLDITDLFDYPTVAEIATVLDQRQTEAAPVGSSVEPASA